MTNDTLKTIFDRRSIRTYKQEQITQEELQTVIDAGRFAPSAMNQQPWHFTVVQNQDLLHRINETIKNSLLKSDNPKMVERASSEGFSVFYNSPTLIIVSGDESAVAPQSDCSLALGNMFLAAHSIGLGTCWINSLKRLNQLPGVSELIKEMGIPNGHLIFGATSLGYNSSSHPTAPARKEGTVTIIK